jgi:putative endonuclease
MGIASDFPRRYRMNRLVHYEVFERVTDAIAREKELKGWRREKKLALIEQTNAGWLDLSAGLDRWRPS